MKSSEEVHKEKSRRVCARENHLLGILWRSGGPSAVVSSRHCREMIKSVWNAVLICLLTSSLTRVLGWDDFFHPPSSESPLGGGLKLPKLPKLPSVPKTSGIFTSASLSSREKTSVGNQRSGVRSPEAANSKKATKTLSPVARKDEDARKTATGKKESKAISKGKLGPGTPAIVWTFTIIGFALKKFLMWRENRTGRVSDIQHTEQESSQSGGEESVLSTRKWRPWGGESTRQSVEKIQKDQEECWRVLHSVYKKHAALEDSVKTLQERQATDSNKVLEGAEELSRHVALFEAHMKEMDSIPDTLTADIAEIRTVLSSCATKAELEKMAKLVKDFVENLKEAL